MTPQLEELIEKTLHKLFDTHTTTECGCSMCTTELLVPREGYYKEDAIKALKELFLAGATAMSGVLVEEQEKDAPAHFRAPESYGHNAARTEQKRLMEEKLKEITE